MLESNADGIPEAGLERAIELWEDAVWESRQMAKVEGLVGKVVRSIETGTVGVVVRVGSDGMLQLREVDMLCFTVAGGDLRDWVSDEVVYYDFRDVRLVETKKTAGAA